MRINRQTRENWAILYSFDLASGLVLRPSGRTFLPITAIGELTWSIWNDE